MKIRSKLVCARYASRLGPMLLAASDEGLAGLWFEGQRHWPAEADDWEEVVGHPVLHQAMDQLDQYFAGTRTRFELPLDLSHGTDFQRSVWQALLEIPLGSTLSYSAVSERIGAPSAVRAVGAAVGRNPLSIVVPCHRVLGRAGALTGYAGGMERKSALLHLEGVACP